MLETPIIVVIALLAVAAVVWWLYRCLERGYREGVFRCLHRSDRAGCDLVDCS
jgi:hypothetical protein